MRTREEIIQRILLAAILTGIVASDLGAIGSPERPATNADTIQFSNETDGAEPSPAEAPVWGFSSFLDESTANAFLEDGSHSPGDIQLAQGLAPNRQAPSVNNQASRRCAAATSAVSFGLASIPYMIGDTGAGTCLTVSTIGYLDLELAHPTLTCSRLNISENNRALPTDRVYYSQAIFTTARRIGCFNSARLSVWIDSPSAPRRLFWMALPRSSCEFRSSID